MKKISYKGLTAVCLAKKRAQPGDVIRLVLRNEESNDGMYAQATRVKEMFLGCYGFLPTSVAVHPDHLTLLKRQGKRLDITIPEEAASEIAALLTSLDDLPRVVPLVGDETLDLFTCVACYTFESGESLTEMIVEAMQSLL